MVYHVALHNTVSHCCTMSCQVLSSPGSATQLVDPGSVICPLVAPKPTEKIQIAVLAMLGIIIVAHCRKCSPL